MGRILTKWLWRFFIIGLLLFTATIAAIEFGLLGYMPSMEELENPTNNESSTVFAVDGTILGKYFYENRTPVEYKDISKNIVQALVATEDERYYEHSGIDGIAIMRAVFNFGNKGGGSTITQQLAKNLFPRDDYNKFTLLFVKLKEWVTAVKMERNLTKDEIITLYLNTVPFGGNIFGIKTAANTFYNKEPKDLTVDEAAVLVGMLKANTRFNPKRNPDNAKGRRNVVIQKMVDNKYLAPSEAQKLMDKPIELNYKIIDHHTGRAPYFRQVLEQELKKWCKSHTKPDGSQYDIYKDGLRVYTTIDSKMQEYAEEAVEEHLGNLQKIFITQHDIKTGAVWKKNKARQNVLKKHIEESDRYLSMKQEGFSHEQIMTTFNKPIKMKVFAYKAVNNEKDTVMSPLDSITYMRSFLQAGFMVMDPYTGEIKAWVGGINHKFFQLDHVNAGTRRQVGSTIKPFVYCMAIDYGISPCSSISTAPQKFPGQKLYDAGGSKYGALAMNSALAASINNASLYLLRQVGINNFVDFIKRTGITSKIEPVPSIALGVSDISVYEMLWAYSMFPNQGFNSKPLLMVKIADKYGNVLETFTPESKEIISSATSMKMIKMMQGVVAKGTAASLRSYGLSGDIAGKTGTTNNQADAWFIGFTPQYLAGAWVGCDDRFLRFNSGMGQGARAALPIWGLFFKKMKNDKSLDFDNDKKFVFPKGFDFCAAGSGTGKNAGGIYTGSGSTTTDDKVEDGTTDPADPANIPSNNGDLDKPEIIRDDQGNIKEEIPGIPGAMGDLDD